MPLMKTNRQKSNWILDALLFTGFLVSFALDWTGLPMHQWVGIFGGLLAVYHLVIHWDWVAAVTLRLFGKTSGQARTYYLLDALVLLGFYVILVSGLLISTWLDLTLTNYAMVKDFHVIASIVTLVLVVLKIGLHWRWIVNVARQHVFRPVVKPVPAAVRTPVPGAMTRADFLKLMCIVGAASLVAVTFTLNDNVEAQASAASVDTTTSGTSDTTTTSTNTTTTQEVVPTATVQPTATETVTVSVPTATATTQSVTQVQTYTSQTTACIVRCNKHCSYPGHCRKYQDTNGNNLCDLGECM